jgi:signal transduction histidine kinase
VSTLATAPIGEQSSTVRSAWECGFDHAMKWIPYVTLGIGTALALGLPRSGQNGLLTMTLAGLTALWVFFMFSRAPERRRTPAWTRVYFAGLTVAALVLMLHNPFFFVFPIAGFFHSSLLRPAPLIFLGVFATSVVINMMMIYPNASSESLWIYGTVVAIQTIASGFGILGGEKISQLSEFRRQAVVELEEVIAENKDLHAQLLAQAREAGVVDERNRLAREIHDTIAQGLIGVITQLEAATNVRSDQVEFDRHLDNAARLARESLVEARRAVRAAMPIQLEGNQTLHTALGDVVGSWTALNGVPVEWSVTGTAMSLRPEVEVTALRVVQEALANVARHANASRVGVTLSYMGDVVSVDVRDDGDGFALNGSRREGFGLNAMLTRVESMSGSLQVESEPGRGTAVSATLPAVGLAAGDE